MEFSIFDIVLNVLNIVVLFVLLRVILYKPVSKFMQQRKEKQQQEKEQLATALAEAKLAADENQQQLNEARAHAQQMVEERKAYADQMAAETIEAAKHQAAGLVEEATERIRADRQKAQEEFINQTADIAVELAKQILGREVSREDNQHLIDDFFRKVG